MPTEQDPIIQSYIEASDARKRGHEIMQIATEADAKALLDYARGRIIKGGWANREEFALCDIKKSYTGSLFIYGHRLKADGTPGKRTTLVGTLKPEMFQ
jgi:hypothetical protein